MPGHREERIEPRAAFRVAADERVAAAEQRFAVAVADMEPETLAVRVTVRHDAFAPVRPRLDRRRNESCDDGLPEVGDLDDLSEVHVRLSVAPDRVGWRAFALEGHHLRVGIEHVERGRVKRPNVHDALGNGTRGVDL